MKKKSASRSGFFNFRVLIALLMALAGVFLALGGLGAFSALTAGVAQAQQKHQYYQQVHEPRLLPAGFDCSRIHALGIDKQENLRAGLIMIACGEAEGGSPSAGSAFSQFVENLLSTPGVWRHGRRPGHRPRDCSHITQSETYTTANPDNPNQIVVTYNDSRTASGCYAGGSFSSDGGTTFTRLTPSPFCSGHGTNFGDPVTLYNRPTQHLVYGIFIATGCGGLGLGAWTSTDGGLTWAIGACVHNGANDDRESGYADNNPSSPFFGRMYVSWNDFAVGGGAIQVVRSTDNGTTWSAAVTVAPSFIRNVQITGDKVTGDRVHRWHGRDGWRPHQPGEQDLSLHGRRRHLDQYLHGPHLPWARAQLIAAFSPHVCQPRLLATHGLG